MANKTMSQAVAFGGLLGFIYATFIEPNNFGIIFAGVYMVLGFWNWIEIEKERKSLKSRTTEGITKTNNENKRRNN